jgi:two-component system chemotaxis response regulator CheY
MRANWPFSEPKASYALTRVRFRNRTEISIGYRGTDRPTASRPLLGEPTKEHVTVKYLIVDDDGVCREVVKTILSPFGVCDLAYNGQEAVGAFRMALDRGEPYDLVCLDIMMPGSNGHAVLDSIRQIEHQRGILGSDGVKVIMATGVRDPKQCVQAFREGCESYVSKPVAEHELLEQVQSLLGELNRAQPGTPSGRKPSKRSGGASRKSAAAPQGQRYLIVDDDRLCREWLKAILSRFGQCDFADNGDTALEAVRTALESGCPYNVICLDIMMPGMNGHEALTAIRQLEAEHGIQAGDGTKVIMITAVSDSKQCVRAFREGCESFVTKPVRKEDLLLRMNQLGLIEAEAK